VSEKINLAEVLLDGFDCFLRRLQAIDRCRQRGEVRVVEIARPYFWRKADNGVSGVQQRTSYVASEATVGSGH
jgi:hypothetical protein